MLKHDKNIPSIALIEEIKKLCNSSGEIRNEKHQKFYGEITLCIQKGRIAFVRRNETIM